MAQHDKQSGARLEDLVAVMQRLLAEDGCPWDRQQTLHTLRPYLLEEAHEVLEAIDLDDVAEHRAELGDLLFQIVFQSALREAQGHFGIDDVCQGIVDKMRRRHPHVFGDQQVRGAEEVAQRWAQLKAAERTDAPRGTLDGIPAALPALLRAQRLGERAAGVGFDWPDVQGVRDKVDEELGELDEAMQAGDRAAIEHELGDLLFTLTRLSAKLGLPPEDALRAANRRFEGRFRGIEALAQEKGQSLADMTLDEMDQLWQAVKRREAHVHKK